jgi:hypothetical protein
MFENIQHLEIDLCTSEAHFPHQVANALSHFGNPGKAKNLQSLTFKTHPHRVDKDRDLGRPLTELCHATWTRPTFFPELSMDYPQLRRLEFNQFTIYHRAVPISHSAILSCLNGLQRSLDSLVFNNCVFKMSLLMVFTEIREMKLAPLVTTFKHSKDYESQPVPEKPSVMTDEAITPYLVWQGMNHSLSLHNWDKQVKEYADQHSEDTMDA